MIVGTAGHIDHGKTALVRALTGVDTDRLPEEKRRGITIELGFAPLPLPGVGVAGVVDVPGHEAFVRTMLAGATGVDVALLVVAADEGVMPQTREHLAILELLGVRAAVVALTKCDLVEDDWLALVAEEVRETLAATLFAAAPIVPTSVLSGAGLDALRTALGEAVARSDRRPAEDLFRMPVDRAFSVRGTGTVVTGTVWSGAVARDAHLRLLPSGRAARVRTLQAHGHEVAQVAAGARAALALVGVEVEAAGRGTVLVDEGAWTPASLWRADATLLADAPHALGPRTRVRLHLGTAEVGARIVASAGALQPGERRAVRVVLDTPLVARAGDRFVLRGGTRATTLGGGTVTDPMPPGRRARPWPAADLPVEDRLSRMLDEGGAAGVAVGTLPVRLGLRPTEVERLTGTGAGMLRVGGRVLARSAADAVAECMLALLDAHHAGTPLDVGLSRQALRAALEVRIRAPADVSDAVLTRLVAEGSVELDGAVARRRGWIPRLSEAQQRTSVAVLARLEEAGLEAPAIGELTAAFGRDVPALLALALRSGQLVQLDADRLCTCGSLDRGLATLQAHLTTGAVYSPGTLRELLGISRKYLMSLLEHLDREGLTDKLPEGRRWRGEAGRSRVTSHA